MRYTPFTPVTSRSHGRDALRGTMEMTRSARRPAALRCAALTTDRGAISCQPAAPAEHLRNPEEMAAYLEACFEESGGDAAFIAKALGDRSCQGHVPSCARCRALPVDDDFRRAS